MDENSDAKKYANLSKSTNNWIKKFSKRVEPKLEDIGEDEDQVLQRL